MPIPLKTDKLESNVQGIYAAHFNDWTLEGLSEKEKNRFDSIHHVATIFKSIITSCIEQLNDSKKNS